MSHITLLEAVHAAGHILYSRTGTIHREPDGFREETRPPSDQHDLIAQMVSGCLLEAIYQRGWPSVKLRLQMGDITILQTPIGAADWQDFLDHIPHSMLCAAGLNIGERLALDLAEFSPSLKRLARAMTAMETGETLSLGKKPTASAWDIQTDTN